MNPKSASHSASKKLHLSATEQKLHVHSTSLVSNVHDLTTTVRRSCVSIWYITCKIALFCNILPHQPPGTTLSHLMRRGQRACWNQRLKAKPLRNMALTFPYTPDGRTNHVTWTSSRFHISPRVQSPVTSRTSTPRLSFYGQEWPEQLLTKLRLAVLTIFLADRPCHFK